MSSYKVIGLMSGTSLDGLDIAYCEFERRGKRWSYKIKTATTLNYSVAWKKMLSSAFTKRPAQIALLDKRYGEFIGESVNVFIKRHKLSPDLIASHGHTVFHRPEKKITLQIGNGRKIATVCKVPVICDFRSGDVQLGGQGAPLVPLVDKILFSNYDLCLNLGGFANISFDDRRGKRIAFDICPANIVLNELAGKLGKEFDKGGRMAANGKIDATLLARLNRVSFYKKLPPKSLGREWVEKNISPVLRASKCSVPDKLRTFTEHVAIQIAAVANLAGKRPNQKLLITGGGAYNTFLIKRLRKYAQCKITLPEDRTIQFKEAMAFAFLGLLKLKGEINILKSVTGARRDSSGGTIFLPY